MAEGTIRGGQQDNVRTSNDKPMVVEVRDTDPTNAVVGRIWFRSDL